MAEDHDLTFYHPYVSDKTDRGILVISTGADQISWGYNLNTVTFPTYGGEVVQILSAYTDDITVTGTVRTYHKMEEIYEWFLTYMQVASQGLDTTVKALGGQGSYSQQPITMEYPTRGWSFKIQVTSLPGFKYGREVVAPTWQITAHVIDDDPDVTSINEAAAIQGVTNLHAGIGFNDDDAFSDPRATESSKLFKGADQRELFTDLADYYSSLIPKYLEGNAVQGQIGSEPAFARRGTPQNVDGKQVKPKAKPKDDK